MNLIKLLLLAGLAPSLLMAQSNGLTLAETREKVQMGNPSIREAVQRIAAAEAVLKQARSAYLPTLSFEGSYGYIDTSLHPEVDINHRHADHFRQASGGLHGGWLLFDGFARQARVLGAKYRTEQSRELSNETRRLLIFSATVSFRQAQLAQEKIAIAKQDHRFNLNLEADARKRYEAGTLPEADVHNFSIRALQAESAMLQAQLNYKTACAVLAELMALPNAQLPENMQPAAIAFDVLESIPAMEHELRYALLHRPDYKAIQSEQFALAQHVRAVKGDLLPQLALVGEINYIDNEGLSTVSRHGNYDSFIGVSAQWDLFTGGRKINTVKQAQAEMRAMEEQRETLRLSIRSSLRQRIDEAETARAVFERQEKIYELSENVRDSIEKSYKAGKNSITRLNESQTDLVRAKGAYSTAYIAFQLIRNQLDIETGRIFSQM